MTITQLFISILKDPNRKSLLKMAGELIYLTVVHRCIPFHYFSRYLFRKDRANINVYLPNQYLHSLKPKFNDKNIKEVLENKLFFSYFFGQFKVHVPRTIMFNHQHVFGLGDQSLNIHQVADFKDVLGKVLKENTSDGSIFIKRTYGTYGGEKIFKVTLKQLENNDPAIEAIYLETVKSAFLFQDTIQQHTEMSRINSSCVNTIRFDTFIDKDGNIEIISAYLRMSINNLCVDNIGSGGCAVAIDLKTGKLKKDGFMIFRDRGDEILHEHPHTKVVFENFQIPLFQEAKEMVLRAAGYVPALRLIGWDVAIGESFPILVEGNSDYDLTGNDLTEGGYLTNPIFRKVLDEAHYF